MPTKIRGNKGTTRANKSGSSVLFLSLILISGIYIGWLLFVLKNFHLFFTFENDGTTKQGVWSDFTGFHQTLSEVKNDSPGNPDDLLTNPRPLNEPSYTKSAFNQRTEKGFQAASAKHNETTPEVTANVQRNNNIELKSITQTRSVPKSESSRMLIKLSNFTFERNQAKKAVDEYSKLQKNNRRVKVLTAFIEKPMNDTIPNTEDQGTTEKYIGTPPEFVIPLPLRTTQPSELYKVQYPKLNSCHKLQAKLPVDEGLIIDNNGNRVINNLGNKQEVEIDLYEEAKSCPVEADPYLPWIHDLFPSSNGDVIHFVAQNKRRCRTSVRFVKTLKRLEPQVAIMQHVSVKRLNDEEANDIAPELWQPSDDDESFIKGMPRYRLAPFDESDADGQLTRFICRFHTVEINSQTGELHDVIIGETLSTFPANYEFTTFRKRNTASMLTPRGKDNGNFWLSNFQFDCPVPDNGNLREAIASGETVLDDGTPTVYVDVVAIRTSPRFGTEELYLPDYMTGLSNNPRQGSFYPNWIGRFNTTLDKFGFDPKKRWGDSNVLPRFEASGRWENLPVCLPSKPVENMKLPVHKKTDRKHHTLAACVWTSFSFHTRGNFKRVTDTNDRLREWIEFHLLSGFDHIYVYDNSAAHSNETSLVEVLSAFNSSEVTRIDWPFQICNNNNPKNANTGERSSQYAAEGSCLRRFGPYTEWMGSFDVDEYLIPMGDYTSMKDVVKDAHLAGTNILSFKSTRGYPNIHFTEPLGTERRCGSAENPTCRIKRSNETFVETYNCDRYPLPKPDWAKRAKKQLYRPDHVISHFVHYSTITKNLIETYKDVTKRGGKWKHMFDEDATEHFTDEINQAVMMHTKTIHPSNTNYDPFCKHSWNNSWSEKCKKCWLGFPFPGNAPGEEVMDAEGFEYNCYTNEKLSTYWAPKLHIAMKKRLVRI